MPFGVSIRLIVHRNLGFLDNIAAIGNLTGFGIAFGIGRTDNGNLFAIIVVDSEFCTTEVFA